MKKIFIALMAAATVLNTGVIAFADTTNNEFEISFGADEETGIVASENIILTPGETYNFPMIVDVNGGYIQIENSAKDDYKIIVDDERGSASIDYVKVVEGQDGLELEVAVEAGWPASITDVEYQIKMDARNSENADMDGAILFGTGYPLADDNAIADLDEGDYVEVDPSAPVYSEYQLENISDINNHDRVTFMGDNWTYNVSVAGRDAVNLLNNDDAIDEIIEAFDENDFIFLNFPAGPQFGRGTLEIDVTNVEEAFGGEFFMYRYYKGKLTQLDSSFDADTGLMSVSTGDLGRFVITDKEIEDGTIVEYGFGGVDNPDNAGVTTAPETTKPEVEEEKENPSTGR